MTEATAVERILRHDRTIVGTGLVLVAGLAWTYVFAAMGGTETEPAMSGMGAMAMARIPWSVANATMTALMWIVMMIAMMVPSAAPTILLFAAVNRRQRQQRRPHVATSVFLAGYLAIWSMFSLLATLLQWVLHAGNLLSPLMASTSAAVSGGFLVAAGIYQLTPLKYACLSQCRSPLQFLSSRWKPGSGGALLMGVEHGAYCVGCCWLLMVLLFVGGVMHPLWIGGIAIYVLVEKLTVRGVAISRAMGLALIAAGLGLMTGVI